MRPSRISYAMAAIMLMAAPAAFAQDAPPDDVSIIFVAGTGGAAAYADTGAAPVPSAPKKDTAAEMTQMADKLSDPAMQDGVAGMVETMVGGLMKLPVGKFAAAIEDARPGTIKDNIPAGATLADLAGPQAEGAPEILGEQSRKAMGMMSGFAKVFAAMLPEFEALGKQMEEDFKAAKLR